MQQSSCSAVSPWTDAHTALWRRIAEHPFGAPDQALDFTRRLARDKGWSAVFTTGAIAEYRRFAFLCVVSPTPMTPSEEVDEVWHQHLIYSRDYWDVWCPTVLGARLHHDPTRGGPAQQAHFRAQYATTLATYETWFGPPPEAYWPATHRRFRTIPRFRTIDTDHAMILPRLWRKA